MFPRSGRLAGVLYKKENVADGLTQSPYPLLCSEHRSITYGFWHRVCSCHVGCPRRLRPAVEGWLWGRLADRSRRPPGSLPRPCVCSASPLALGIVSPGGGNNSGGLCAPQPPLGFPSSRWSSTAGYPHLRWRGNALPLPAERAPPARDLGSPAANLRTGGKRAGGEGGPGDPRSQGGRERGTWADRLPDGLLGEDWDGSGVVVWRSRSERPRTHHK